MCVCVCVCVCVYIYILGFLSLERFFTHKELLKKISKEKNLILGYCVRCCMFNELVIIYFFYIEVKIRCFIFIEAINSFTFFNNKI